MGVHHLLYWVIVFMLTALFFSVLSGQVTIRDTVRIDPGPEAVAASLPVSTVSLVFTHNGNIDMSPTTSRSLTLRNRFCGDNMTATIDGPVTVVAVPARGFGVEASTGFRVLQSPNVERAYAFYLDGELIDSLHTVAQCPVSCIFVGHILNVPLYSSFQLGVDHPFRPFELNHGETAQKFTLDYSSTLCGTTVWNPNCATTVQITQGAELGTLIGADGAELGDSFVGRADEIKQLRFSANGQQPSGEVGEAVVEVSSRGITSRVTFEIRRTVPPVHHLEVTLNPDTVHHGMAAEIFVTAVNEEGAEVNLPPETPLEIYVGAGSEAYGDLAASIHGTPARGDQLSGVRYDQAKAGGVVYIADGKNPIGVDPPQVPIGVQLKGVPDVAGAGVVAVACRIESFTVMKQWGGGWEDNNYDHYVKSIKKENRSGGVVRNDTTFWKIRQKGCALSTFAMMLDYWDKEETPGTLNTKMTPKFISARTGEINWLFARTYGDIDFRRIDGVFPPAVRDLNGRILRTFDGKDSLDFSRSKAVHLSSLNMLVQKCIPAAVYVVNPDRNTGHFVVVLRKANGTYEIADPGKDRVTLQEYNNTIYGIRYLMGAL